jgi:hypothetical protein
MDEKRSKEELLAELESIKALLDGEPLNDGVIFDTTAQGAASDAKPLAKTLYSSPKIPTLNKMVFEDKLLNDVSNQQFDRSKTAAHKALSNQQFLLEQAKLKHKKANAKLETSSDHSTNTDSVDQAPHRPSALYNFVDGSLNNAVDNSLVQALKSSRDKTLQRYPNNSFSNSANSSINGVTENPFLPKHIRERLTKPSDLEAILAGDPNKRCLLPPIIKTTVDNDSIVPYRMFSSNSFLKTSRSGASNTQSLKSALDQTTSYKNTSVTRPEIEPEAKPELVKSATRSDAKMDLLVDELVAQYLPEIEAKLRFQLKQALMHTPENK